jgi:hypothetical protein
MAAESAITVCLFHLDTMADSSVVKMAVLEK